MTWVLAFPISCTTLVFYSNTFTCWPLGDVALIWSWIFKSIIHYRAWAPTVKLLWRECHRAWPLRCGSGNGLLPDRTKPLPEPLLIGEVLWHPIAWCGQAISHYLNQCFPRFKSPYSITRLQWVHDHHGSHTEMMRLTTCTNVHLSSNTEEGLLIS